MSIKKSGSQVYFEGMFTGSSGIPFRQIPKTQYEQTILTRQQAEDIKNLLADEIAPYYYKALLSYMESITALESKLFSWATVKLYYSVFYAIKAYLACKDTAILRAERKLFYVKAKENETIRRCADTTDHKGTILTLEKLYKNSDMLLSNNIDNTDVYHWMMKKREEVNYKDLDFHDPSAPDFWSELNNEIEIHGIRTTIDKMVNDNWLYCFQDEYAILGIPTKRILLTVNEIHRQGRQLEILEEKKQLIDSMSTILSENSVQALEIWKRS